MFKLSSGLWIYLLTIFLLILFGLYLSLRFNQPLISYEKLVSPSSRFNITQSDPCLLHIIGGIPFSPLPDGNIQANIYCSENKSSPNYIKLSTLPNRSLIEVLNILSSVNNFSIKFDKKNKIESLGDIKNSSSQSWHIYVNNSEMLNELNQNIVKINDVVDFKYE